jgi:hypothetical protein
MQKLFPPVSVAASAGPNSPDAPEANQPAPAAAAATPEPAEPTVRPFDWPPPEEDLEDWHVFKFAETPASTPQQQPPPEAQSPEAQPEPEPEPLPLPQLTAPAQTLKESETPTLKIVSPYAEKQIAGLELTARDLADAALADTAEISNDDATNPQLVTPSRTTPRLVTPPRNAPLSAPRPDAPTLVAPVAPPSFRTPDTEPIVVALQTPSSAQAERPVAHPAPATAAASRALSGALKESGSALPVRRTATPPPVPMPTAAKNAPLMSATVDLITRGAQAQTQAARLPRSSWSWRRRTVVIALALVATGEAAYIATLMLRTPGAASQTAVLFVQSQPTGAEILIDGKSRGRTPFRAELPPGQHTLELRKDQVTRKFPLVLAAGTSASQYVEMRTAETDPTSPPTPSAPGPNGGANPGSHAASQPNEPRAASPTAASATASPAAASVTAPSIAAESTVAPRAPVVRPVPSVGWLVVQSTVPLSILRNGESIGNSEDGRIAIVPGPHELELSNDAAGYREATTIQIVPGQVTTLRPELPQSTLDIEARPTAKVLIDGREVGDTPLTQIALTIGLHEVILRHPDFPDRRVSAYIKVGAPSKVSVDLSTP